MERRKRKEVNWDERRENKEEKRERIKGTTKKE